MTSHAPAGHPTLSREELIPFLSPAQAAGAPTFCDATESRQRTQPRGLCPLGHPPTTATRRMFGLAPTPRGAPRLGAQAGDLKVAIVPTRNSAPFFRTLPSQRDRRPTLPPAASRNVRHAHLRCRWRQPRNCSATPLLRPTLYSGRAPGRFILHSAHAEVIESLLRRGARGLEGTALTPGRRCLPAPVRAIRARKQSLSARLGNSSVSTHR